MGKEVFMNKRRVVVTGMGIVSPFGLGVKLFWDSLKAGKSGITKIESIPLEGQSVTVAGEVKNFAEQSGLDPKELKRSDRYMQFANVAAREAMEDAGLKKEDIKDPY